MQTSIKKMPLSAISRWGTTSQTLNTVIVINVLPSGMLKKIRYKIQRKNFLKLYFQTGTPKSCYCNNFAASYYTNKKTGRVGQFDMLKKVRCRPQLNNALKVDFLEGVLGLKSQKVTTSGGLRPSTSV